MRFYFKANAWTTGNGCRGYYELNAYLLGTIEEEIFPTIKEFHGFTYRVDPETVGQYTGWDDCNGQKIFEGHIIKISVPIILGGKPIVGISEVYFDKGCFCVNWGGSYRPHHRMRIDSFIQETMFEVIGNIHDNPELLGAVATHGSA